MLYRCEGLLVSMDKICPVFQCWPDLLDMLRYVFIKTSILLAQVKVAFANFGYPVSALWFSWS